MRTRFKARGLLLWFAAAAFVAVACDAGGLVGGDCKAGRLFCNGQCIDPLTDPNNCGSCNNVCAPGLVCSVGDCVAPGSGGMGGTPGGAGAGADAGGTAAQGGEDSGGNTSGGLPETGGMTGEGGAAGGSANGGRTARGGSGGSEPTPVGGAPGCLPPFDSAEQCGDCDTQCSGDTPLCAPSALDDSYECVPLCPPPLEACGDQCVDTNVSPLHCGQCFNLCPSGICQDGQCVGANPGHVGLYCLDYTWAEQQTAHTALLGNAVFLPLRNEVRILAFTRYAAPAVRQQVDRVIFWSSRARGRTYRIDSFTDGMQLSSVLNVFDYDVFMVYDQANATSPQLTMLGNTWRAALEQFAKAGGVVVALNGAQGNGAMPDFIRAAGLYEVDGHNAIALDDRTTRFYNRAAGDALGIGVVSPLSPVPYSCTFQTSSPPDATTTFVVSDAQTGIGNPVVIHRVVP